MRRHHVLGAGLFALAAFALQLPPVASTLKAGTAEAATNTTVTCVPLENFGYTTYDKHVPCRVSAPAGTKVIVAYPAKYDGRLGLTPGPTQDSRPFSWGIINVTSPGWDCRELPYQGLVCTPNGQPAGFIDIAFEGVGDCGAAANIASKAVSPSAANEAWRNDGTWALHTYVFPACPAGRGPQTPPETGTVPVAPQQPGANTTIICTQLEYAGYLTYDKHVPCRVSAPAGTKVIVAYPAKYDGRLGLTPGPTQDSRPFSWGIINVTSPGWDCRELPYQGLVCTPNGQPAGFIDISFEAVGDCAAAANVASKALPANAPNEYWVNDGTWALHTYVFPRCPAESSSSAPSSSSVSSVPSSSSSSAQSSYPSVPQLGCVEILNETFNPQGQPLPVTASFTYVIDDGRTATNDASGRARFDNVPVGTRVVSQTTPAGWTPLSVTPAGGTVYVNAGSACAGVVFKNQQAVPQQSSSYSSSSAYGYPYDTPSVSTDADVCLGLRDAFGNLTFRAKKLRKSKPNSNLLPLLESCVQAGY